MERGRIVKALSGFYYVDSGNGTLTQCRARGRFRKERMSPLVGDWVRFSGSGAQGMVEEIEPVAGGTLLLTLNGVEEKIPVSRRRVSALKKALGL